MNRQSLPPVQAALYAVQFGETWLQAVSLVYWHDTVRKPGRIHRNLAWENMVPTSHPEPPSKSLRTSPCEASPTHDPVASRAMSSDAVRAASGIDAPVTRAFHDVQLLPDRLLSPLPASQTRLRDFLRFAARRVDEERLPQVAGSLTFTTVLGLVPLLTIALAIFTAFPLFATFRTSLESYFSANLMPRAIASTILEYLNQFASKSMRLSAVGAIALVFTAVTMMSMIDRVFNRIWRIATPRPLVHRVLIYWALVTLGPLLIGVSLTITTYLFSATSGTVMRLRFLGEVFYSLVSLVLTTGAFSLLYATVPNRAINWKDAAAGGLLAGLAFEIAKRLFALYVTKFPTYTMVYGSVAAIPIFLLWIYMFWMITLAGALLAAALPIVKYERWWHLATPGSAFVDAVAILKVLFDARTAGSSAAVDANRIRNRTRLGFDESEALLDKMHAAGWVGRVRSGTPRRHFRLRKRVVHGGDGWTLLANPQRLRLADVYRMFVFEASGDDPLIQQVEGAVEQGLTQTLASHFGSVEPRQA